MIKKISHIEIRLDEIKKGLRLWIDPRKPDTLFEESEIDLYSNEAPYKLLETCIYDFEFSDSNFILKDIGENIIQAHKRTPNLGSIAPNIFVGTLSIPILTKDDLRECGIIYLEVQSIKTDYRQEYRDMLEFITEKCSDLLLKINSPVSQQFDVDQTRDSQSLYQKYSFINSVINTEDFKAAVHKIVTSPVTKWKESFQERDTRGVRKYTNSNIKEILNGKNRTEIPDFHYLRTFGLNSIPRRISTTRKVDSLDTPENRFIKHALSVFLKFCSDINIKAREFEYPTLQKESESLIRKLEEYLHHSFFNEISRPSILKLNSPVLQRKEGYREILRIWLMFDLSAKLIWKGGEDVYSSGKKDVASLYEYWLFFKLLDLLQEIFRINPKDISELIKETPDGMNLELRQGKFTALRGFYDTGTRKLNISFCYNRSFSGNKTYPDSGSWTTTLRPDYTLSLWPFGISEIEAEQQELIVHIHFDAKYKILNLVDFLDPNSKIDLDNEKKENRKGVYKNADLLKMHAYKDAIRRSGGAYVLYPGDKSTSKQGFHEIIPGLGAFSVIPSRKDNGIGQLKAFILEIVDHFINRSSQREKIALRTFDVYKSPPDVENIINDPLPENYNLNRAFLPDETFVLIGYFKSNEHYDWIKKSWLYNFRMNSERGSLVLENEVVNAKYLLLHTLGDSNSNRLWKIVSKGPKVFSKSELVKIGYPSPSVENYLVIQIEPVTDIEFEGVEWNFKKLKRYSDGRASSLPFTASISELMKSKNK